MSIAFCVVSVFVSLRQLGFQYELLVGIEGERREILEMEERERGNSVGPSVLQRDAKSKKVSCVIFNNESMFVYIK